MTSSTSLGHRLSTGAIEEVLASHSDVAECAVVGAADALKGEIPLGLVVLKAGVQRSHSKIIAELIQAVREKDWPGSLLQSGDGCEAAAQDAVRQDCPWHHQENR